MANATIIDEFHVTVRISRGVTDRQSAAIRRKLDAKRFQFTLLRAIRAVFRQHSALRMTRVTLSR